MRGGLPGGWGSLLRGAALCFVYVVLAVIDVYQNVVSNFVADRIASSRLHWLAAPSVIMAVLVLAVILRLGLGPKPAGGLVTVTFLLLAALQVIAIPAYESEVAALTPPQLTRVLVWTAPLSVFAVWLIQLSLPLLLQLFRRKPRDLRKALQAKMEKTWEQTYPIASAGHYPLALDTELDDGRTTSAGADLTGWIRTAGGVLMTAPAGAGKTSKLVELMKASWEDDSLAPPIAMFRLANYGTPPDTGTAGGRPVHDLERWMISVLAQDPLSDPTSLAPAAARDLLADGANPVLIFLDGLDQVPPRHRSPCIRAISEFRRARPAVPLLVTSADDDPAAAGLGLPHTARLLPPQVSDIHKSLRQAGADDSSELHQAVDNDESVRELLQLPLVLAMIASKTINLAIRADRERLTLGGITNDHVHNSLTKGKARLDDSAANRAQQWLSFIAACTNDAFHPESLRPADLDRANGRERHRRRRRLPPLHRLLPGAVIFTILVMFFRPSFGAPLWYAVLSTILGLAFSIGGAALVTWIAFNVASPESLSPRRGLRLNTEHFRYIPVLTKAGLICGGCFVGLVWVPLAIISLIGWLAGGRTFRHDPYYLLFGGEGKVSDIVTTVKWFIAPVLIAVYAGLVAAFVAGLRPVRERPGDGNAPALWAGGAGAITAAGYGGAVYGALAVFDAFNGPGPNAFSYSDMAQAALFVALIAGLCYGGWVYLVYLGLRLDLALRGLLPLRVGHLLDQAASSRLMTKDSDGYRFRHPVIQRYLADASPGTVSHLRRAGLEGLEGLEGDAREDRRSRSLCGCIGSLPWGWDRARVAVGSAGLGGLARSGCGYRAGGRAECCHRRHGALVPGGGAPSAVVDGGGDGGSRRLRTARVVGAAILRQRPGGAGSRGPAASSMGGGPTC